MYMYTCRPLMVKIFEIPISINCIINMIEYCVHVHVHVQIIILLDLFVIAVICLGNKLIIILQCNSTGNYIHTPQTCQ